MSGHLVHRREQGILTRLLNKLLAYVINGVIVTIDLDLKVIFSGLGFIISLYSLWMAHSAKREAQSAALLELVHQKRMLLGDQFSGIVRVVNALTEDEIEDQELKGLYNQLRDYRDRIITAMNDSSEMMVETRKLNKKRLLNEISDFHLMNAIYKSRMIDLETLIESRQAKSSTQPTPSALVD